ncbi:MAG: major facilitator superfamily 1, partial [Dehalococcoidia bacterium]|nr:major facilitator superfamily 1 [Dehalococcoidia bacterium]
MANVDTPPRAVAIPSISADRAIAAAPGGWRGVFSSLQNRNFRVFWIGMMFSFVGMQMGQVARQWLVYELTGSSTYLGIVGAVTSFPMLFFSMVGGVVADRVVKRNLLIITQTSTGLLAFLIAFLLTLGLVQPWHIIAVAFLSGLIFSFNAPGRQSMIPELVPPEQLMNAIALNSAGMNFTRII